MPEIIDRGDGIQIFDNASIQKNIDKALKIVPSGKSGAVVAFIDEKKNVGIAVAARIGDNWSIAAEAKKGFNKSIEAKAEVVFTF